MCLEFTPRIKKGSHIPLLIIIHVKHLITVSTFSPSPHTSSGLRAQTNNGTF